MHLLEARIRGHVEGKPAKTIGIMVKQIPRGQNLTGGIDRRVEAGPRHIFYAATFWGTPYIREELHIRQAVDLRIDPQFGYPDLKVYVRCINVTGTLQRHTVGADITGKDHARSPYTNRYIRFQSPFDLKTIRNDCLLPYRIDHLQVI